ncbi:MAG: hypothetical protein LBI47_03580 [Puniceicoccales bacterium]|jgi:hypothetical protein|nr:hypothetical protein [Puniceicoccales bacterium]
MPDELAVLTIELLAGEYKIGLFRRFIIRVKTLFSGNYEYEIAKEAFSKIENGDVLPRVAYNYIALLKNASTLKKNMEILAKL